jgi:predicted transcriptional regulator
MKMHSPQEHLCCADVLKAIFELNSLDYQVFQCLQQQGPLRADQIAELFNKERSTIYRSLQKLSTCKLCKKTTCTLPAGGYYHLYSCSETKEIKQEVEHCIDAWYHQVKDTIKKIDKELS